MRVPTQLPRSGRSNGSVISATGPRWASSLSPAVDEQSSAAGIPRTITMSTSSSRGLAGASGAISRMMI